MMSKVTFTKDDRQTEGQLSRHKTKPISRTGLFIIQNFKKILHLHLRMLSWLLTTRKLYMYTVFFLSFANREAVTPCFNDLGL